MTMIWGKPWSKRIMCVELWQWSHLHHTPKPAQRKFGGKHRKFEMVADMLYCCPINYDAKIKKILV